ncbi:BTB domain-containing protein [Mycena sanguinolenta]|uniref:BTB domain-containing protein n=1 Tax=Mycena sanguinolenta TaxID=230812 RepID=A0A8H6XYN4_9AGAR|nr:BTB domain-containing protein [Mycena sanguinolenta]
MSAAPPSRTSERFCDPDADLTISSCDGVLFKVHRKNLEVHSDIFANAANATRPENGDEIVLLEESSDALDLLFQYMYRQRQPDLQLVEFPAFMRFAEAVEKYVVYSALTLMEIRMKEHIVEHPLHVLEFAVRHGHADFANQAARMAVGLPISDVGTILSPDTVTKWMSFYDKWHTEARATAASLISHITDRNRSTLGSSLAECLRDPKQWYEQRSAFRSYVSVTFLDLEFMASDRESK